MDKNKKEWELKLSSMAYMPGCYNYYIRHDKCAGINPYESDCEGCGIKIPEHLAIQRDLLNGSRS